MFEVREPDYSRPPVTGPVGMRRLKLLEAEHALSARGKMRDRSTAHAAQPHHDDVMLISHQVPYFNIL